MDLPEFLKYSLKYTFTILIDKVCGLSNEGLENWEISQELEIHKSTVSRYVKRGKEEGTI